MKVSSERLLLLALTITSNCLLVRGQAPPGGLNLGSFQLNKNPRSGDLEIGFGQGGSLFGYGADRALQLQLGPGKLGAHTDNGLMLGGERVGVDSHLGLREGQALGLGSQLQVGGRPVGPFDALGQLGGLINSLGSLFGPGGGAGIGSVRGRGRPAQRPPSPQPTSPSNRFAPPPIQPPATLAKGDGWDGEGVPHETTSQQPFPTLNPMPTGQRPPTGPAITTEGRREGSPAGGGWSVRGGSPGRVEGTGGGELGKAQVVAGKNDGETGGRTRLESSTSGPQPHGRKPPTPEGMEVMTGGTSEKEEEIP